MCGPTAATSAATSSSARLRSFVRVLASLSLRIAPSHSTCASTHAANADRPCVCQLLHNLMASDVNFGLVDLPTVTWRHVAQCVWVELPWTCRYTEFLNRIVNHLGACVVHLQRCVIVLIDKDLQRLE